MARSSRSESYLAGFAAARRAAADLTAYVACDPEGTFPKLEQAIRRLKPKENHRPGARAPKESK